MKKIVPIIALCLFIPFGMFAQNVVVSLDAVKAFYESVPNPISVVINKCDTKDVSISCDNGNITAELKESGHYIIADMKTGSATIIISKRRGNKIIEVGRETVQVKALPIPEVRLGGNKIGAFVTRKFLVEQVGLACAVIDFDYPVYLKVTKFNVTVIRNGITIFNEDNNSNKFNDATLKMFTTVQMNDHVIFSELYYAGASKVERQLEPTKFNIGL